MDLVRCDYDECGKMFEPTGGVQVWLKLTSATSNLERTRCNRFCCQEHADAWFKAPTCTGIGPVITQAEIDEARQVLTKQLVEYVETVAVPAKAKEIGRDLTSDEVAGLYHEAEARSPSYDWRKGIRPEIDGEITAVVTNGKGVVLESAVGQADELNVWWQGDEAALAQLEEAKGAKIVTLSRDESDAASPILSVVSDV